MQSQHFIIFQVIVEGNLSVVIGSFLVGFCHTEQNYVSFVFETLAQQCKVLTNLQCG